MHRGHHHHHGHDHDFADGEHHHGDNGPSRDAVQWQNLHQRDRPDSTPAAPEPDFDLIEAAFAEGFERAPDPTSFLRLASVPFVARTSTNKRLFLLRVEYAAMTDVGSVMPLLGGDSVRYAPLPAHMTSCRKQLAIVYTDGRETFRLSFGEARELVDETLIEADEMGRRV